jgi:hypothetical protein
MKTEPFIVECGDPETAINASPFECGDDWKIKSVIARLKCGSVTVWEVTAIIEPCGEITHEVAP